MADGKLIAATRRLALEEAAAMCDGHEAWLRDVALSNEDWKDLLIRAQEVAYIAIRIRRMKA
jgi:hypothetical protein